MMNQLFHTGLNFINHRAYLRFINGMKNTKDLQQKKLLGTLKMLRNLPAHKEYLLAVNSYQEFRNLPVASYESIQNDIAKQRNQSMDYICQKVKRFQPTSGSSSAVKWIPYSKALLNEFDQAAAVWLYDLGKQYPGILKGRHYWSLSWLPNELRKEQTLNDGDLLSPLRKLFMNNIFSVPEDVMKADSIEDNLFATATYLCADKDLSLISVWSPTFLLSIIHLIENRKNDIIETLTTGKWPKDFSSSIKAPRNSKQAQRLGSLTNIYDLWPKLALISCWDTAQSKVYADKLKSFFPHTPLQGKGLWATEAVVTLPIQNHYRLAYQSHFFEFEDIETKEVYPVWELLIGQEVSPIVTTSSGLIRYKINDRLRVDSIKDGCPSLTFLGRIGDCDLVGEKLSHDQVESIFKILDKDISPVSMVGVQSPIKKKLPYYLCLAHRDKPELADRIEQELQKIFHYKLARDLKQLGPIVVIASQDVHQIYEKVCLDKGMIKGNIKIDSLMMTKNDEFLYATK